MRARRDASHRALALSWLALLAALLCWPDVARAHYLTVRVGSKYPGYEAGVTFDRIEVRLGLGGWNPDPGSPAYNGGLWLTDSLDVTGADQAAFHDEGLEVARFGPLTPGSSYHVVGVLWQSTSAIIQPKTSPSS